MKTVLITTISILALAASNALAMSTVDIVALAKPCVVTIGVWNSTKKEGSSGTGFFVGPDEVMTAAHVVSVTKGYDSIVVKDLDANTVHVRWYPEFYNGSKEFDIAILKVEKVTDKDGREISHKSLQLATTTPLEGSNVVVIGNPQGLNGTVSTGIVSAVRSGGKEIQFTAPVSNGSSGGPVLNENGEVIGVADRILRPEANETAQNLNFGHGIPLMNLAVETAMTLPEKEENWRAPNQPAANASPSPSPVASNGLVVPKTFGNTRQGKEYSYTEITDIVAADAISHPVIRYLFCSVTGDAYDSYFVTNIGKFFNLDNCTLDQAKADDAIYYEKWPDRTVQPHYKELIVEKVNWSGDTCYLVTLPYDWTVKNGKKSQSGHNILMAFVVQGEHGGNPNHPDYFIGSIWNREALLKTKK